MDPVVTAIIVTHNSREFIGKCLRQLQSQTLSVEEIIIVDNGSDNPDYLKAFANDQNIRVIIRGNLGFSKANNLGFSQRQLSSDFVVFLNPDTFLSSDFVEKAIPIMNRNSHIGILGGKLLGFDNINDRETGKIDSTGVFRKFYGRWFDRGQNENDSGQYLIEEEVPALCGALLFCRIEALKCLNGNIFDPDFFLYKEDIELSLRLRKYGWKLLYAPQLNAYHCRGWRSRSKISYQLKKTAAESEILLYKKHPSPYIIWAFLKYCLVVLFRL